MLLILMAAGSTSGCQAGDPAEGFTRRRPRSVPLRVHNDNFLDITVYAVASGVRIKVGEVPGKSTGDFAINPRRLSMVSGLQIRVDPVGSSRYYLSPLVFPDMRATVVLTVGNILDQSYITVR